MTPEAVIARARAAAHGPLATHYHLGSGGEDPARAHPANGGFCDCSGYACWCLGIARERDRNADPAIRRFPDAWINTDAIKEDAQGGRVLFERTSEAQAGDLIVYGKSATEDYGHVGVITEAKFGLPLQVAHCCARAGLRSAIIEEDAKVFWLGAIRSRGAIFARPRMYEEEYLKKVRVRINSVQTVEGLLDEKNGTTYIALRGEHPTATFSWNAEKTELEVFIPAKQ